MQSPIMAAPLRTGTTTEMNGGSPQRAGSAVPASRALTLAARVTSTSPPPSASATSSAWRRVRSSSSSTVTSACSPASTAASTATRRLDGADLLGQRAHRPRRRGGLRRLRGCDAIADQRDLEVAAEGADLARAGAAGALGAGEGVPRLGEGAEVGAAAVAVRRQHRADAAALVGVGADDDAVGADALEHAPLGVCGQGLDGPAQALAVTPSSHGNRDIAMPARRRDFAVIWEASGVGRSRTSCA